jgi:hypothetical protein
LLSKEVFDKATFNSVNICANQNETLMKQRFREPKLQRKIHTSPWILKISRKNLSTKSLETFANLCDFQTKSILYGLDLKIYRKSMG